MSRSCQSATFSKPTSAAPRTTRARPQIRSAVTGFRLCGIADEPFWPRPNGSSTSRTSVRARWRISSANVSSDEASTASAASSSACRSRWRICVETGAGSSPSRSQAMPLELGVGGRVRADGARELADAQLLERAREAAAPAVELERPAGELEPEGRRLGVDAVRAPDLQRRPVLLGAARRRRRAPASMPASSSAPRLADLQRERRVDHVRRGQAVVEPASPFRVEALADGVDEGGEVVVRPALDLGDALGRRRRRRGADLPRPSPSARRPSSAHASSAASSTSSHSSSLRSSDQTLAISGRE